MPTLSHWAKWAPALALAVVTAPSEFEPARFQSGSLVIQSPMTVGGGEVLLELDVDASGAVAEVTTVRSTPPYTDLLRAAVRAWRFAPAREIPEESEEWVTVPSKVLVAGVFRPPTTYDAPARGEPSQEVTAPSEDVPFPTKLAMAPYPPKASWHIGQTVLVEVEVDPQGKVTGTKVLRSAQGLDEVSRDTAATWSFRPARRAGTTVPSVAYVVFGFREPVVTGEPPN